MGECVGGCMSGCLGGCVGRCEWLSGCVWVGVWV